MSNRIYDMVHWGRHAARVQRVRPAFGGLVQKVQRGRWTVLRAEGALPYGQRVVFALLRGRRPFRPRVVVSPLRGDEYIVSVTRFTLVSTVLHDVEPEPPSLGRNQQHF